MSALGLALGGAGTMVATGLLALVLGRARRLAAVLAAGGVVAGGAGGLWGAVQALGQGGSETLRGTWAVPGGALVVGLDPLSAYFLIPLFALGALAAIYGVSYLGPRPVAAAKLNLLVASMALVLLARHALLFLVAWELMTVLAYLLVTDDDQEALVRRAGFVYLIASHVAMMALFALFLALGARAGGSLDFGAFAQAWHTPASWLAGTGILVLAVAGFGLKAGVVGLHFWLPEAHAAAPSHVSALMSGVLIKLGIYGLLRVALIVTPGAGFGIALMILGALGAVVGISLAPYQRDLKRVLAYSSVENIGVILLGLGLGFWARAHGDPALAAIAFGGGLLHVWNHAAMKGLMFLGAGSVLHATGTKDVERLGGLLGRMPWTATLLLVGSVAIAALPPLNGFASEWLLYRGLATAGMHAAAPANLAAMAGAATLALVGGLAALCFVRLCGVTLLGTARSPEAAHAHESAWALRLPMLVLALLCVAGGLVAPWLVRAQAPLLETLGSATAVHTAAAADLLAPLSVMHFGLWVALAAALALVLRFRQPGAERPETWGCGYAAPTARMQYTGRGFAELVSARVLPRWLRPRLDTHAPEGVFPTAARSASETTDPLTRSIYEPLLTGWGDRFARLRFLQQGKVHIYILYIVATTIIAVGWVVVREWIMR